MRGFVVVGILCGGLAACAVPSPFAVPQLGTAPGNLNADRQACNQTYPPRIGNYLPHAQCVNQAVERDAIPFARYPEIVQLQEQLRAKYSGMIDQGTISPHEGERRMAEADDLVNAAIRDRDQGRQEAADHRVDRLQTMLQ